MYMRGLCMYTKKCKDMLSVSVNFFLYMLQYNDCGIAVSTLVIYIVYLSFFFGLS